MEIQKGILPGVPNHLVVPEKGKKGTTAIAVFVPPGSSPSLKEEHRVKQVPKSRETREIAGIFAKAHPSSRGGKNRPM